MPDRPLVRRRTAVAGALYGSLGGLAATLLATGCDTEDDLTPPSGEPTPSTTGTTTGSTEASDERTPDEILVDDVLADLFAAIDVLALARRFRSLRGPLTPLVRAHRRHVDVLATEGESRTATEVPPNASAALDAVRRSERQLHARLVDAAGQAESGALAKLLASMSASVTQHRLVLPREVAG